MATKGELSVVDWLLCIFCGLIGCIVGIVALIQGDSKRGGIMIGVSIAASVVWGIINTLMMSLQRGAIQ